MNFLNRAGTKGGLALIFLSSSSWKRHLSICCIDSHCHLIACDKLNALRSLFLSPESSRTAGPLRVCLFCNVFIISEKCFRRLAMIFPCVRVKAGGALAADLADAGRQGFPGCLTGDRRGLFDAA